MNAKLRPQTCQCTDQRARDPRTDGCKGCETTLGQLSPTGDNNNNVGIKYQQLSHFIKQLRVVIIVFLLTR